MPVIVFIADIRKTRLLAPVVTHLRLHVERRGGTVAQGIEASVVQFRLILCQDVISLPAFHREFSRLSIEWNMAEEIVLSHDHTVDEHHLGSGR